MKSLVSILLVTSVVLASDTPEQIHVASGTVPGSIIFTWSTRKTTPTSEVRVTTGTTWTTYSGSSRDFRDGSNIWVIHAVTAQLTPGDKYTYEVGSSSTGFTSSYSLVVPTDSDATNVLLFGDLSTDQYGSNTWTDIKGIAKDLLVQAMVVCGDMAYDLSSKSSTVGDNFMNDIQPIAHYVPTMVAAGNHETTDNYYNYLTRFDMPNSKYYYTFTAGLVRFVAIHTEAFLTEIDMLPDMLPFIQSTLNRSPADKLKYPWLVVFGHRPMYCSSKSKAEACGPEADTLKKYLESWFKQFKVDLYVNGHVHNYQRTAPVYQGRVTSAYDNYASTYINPQSTVYVTTGGPGSDGTNSKVDWTDAPDWLVAGEEDYSFSLMNVFNSTHLYWQQLKSKNNALTDSFWIIKT